MARDNLLIVPDDGGSAMKDLAGTSPYQRDGGVRPGDSAFAPKPVEGLGRGDTATAVAARAAAPPAAISSGGTRFARRARLRITHLGPRSAFRLSVTFAACMSVIWLAAVAAVWAVLDSSGVFRSIVHATSTFTSSGGRTDTTVAHWLSFSRVMLIAAALAVLNVLVLSALCTVGSVFYNLFSDFAGGLEATLTER